MNLFKITPFVLVQTQKLGLFFDTIENQARMCFLFVLVASFLFVIRSNKNTDALCRK